jgi:sugar (pentulose or hexulose) kinase
MHDYFVRALGADDYMVDWNDEGFFGLFDSAAGCWNAGERRRRGPERGRGRRRNCSRGLNSVSMGTAVAAFLDAPIRDSEGRMIVTAHPIKGHWLLEGCQAAAASVYRWFKEHFGAQEARDAEAGGRNYCDAMNDRVSAAPAGSRGLLVLPYFAFAGAPRYNPLARGTSVGLTFSHTRFDIARAFMEGITLDMKDMLSSMARSGLRVTKARLLGGPTKSRVWNQI